MEGINQSGFLCADDLELRYSRWEEKWGADFYKGHYRLQLGWLNIENGRVTIDCPFLWSGNQESPWQDLINLLEREDDMTYRFWGSYREIDTAIDALLSLVIMKESVEKCLNG